MARVHFEGGGSPGQPSLHVQTIDFDPEAPVAVCMRNDMVQLTPDEAAEMGFALIRAAIEGKGKQ
ncbi:MAG TPA: hypothetical protein VFW22_16355 [Pseudolabrys sp.]|nr:hypothetical protein [Pseudolabrys sp.]